MSSILVVLLVAACAPHEHIHTDASDVGDAAGPCWPVGGYQPNGSVQLGSGRNDFVAMPEIVQLEFGPGGGLYIPVHSRITGMEPGDPLDIFEPTNPRTRFRGFFVDSGRPINPGLCPGRFGYKPSTETNTYDLAHGVELRFEPFFEPVPPGSHQLRVIVEVIDAQGRYASDEKVITGKPISTRPVAMCSGHIIDELAAALIASATIAEVFPDGIAFLLANARVESETRSQTGRLRDGLFTVGARR